MVCPGAIRISLCISVIETRVKTFSEVIPLLVSNVLTPCCARKDNRQTRLAIFEEKNDSR